MNMSEHDVVARLVAAIERAHQPLLGKAGALR